jgi:hypothetical protein
MAEAIGLLRAKEAVRQAEVRLTGQAAALTTLEVRATSIVSWSVAVAAGALAFALGDGKAGHLQWGAAIGAAVMWGAAALAAQVLRPGEWVVPGHRPPSVLRGDDDETAEGFFRALAEGYDGGISANAVRLRAGSRALRLALGGVLLAGPAAGAASLMAWLWL